MRCLLRAVNRRSRGVVSHRDQAFEGAGLNIGRSTDQDLELPDLRVALHHARVLPSEKGGFLIRAAVPSGVRHNGEVVQTALLVPGDRIGIGDYQITVLTPTAPYDLVFEVEQVRAARGKALEEELLARSGRKATARFGMRAWSWTGALLIFTLFLLLPLAGFTLPDLGGYLRTLLPSVSDSAWNSGELTAGHRFFSRDCNVCHQRAFISVRNNACLACHKEQPHHVDLDVHSLPRLTDSRCASCHREHNGATALIQPDDGQCLNCHRRIEAIAPKAKLAEVSGSFTQGHPEFRASLLHPGAGPEQRIHRVRMDRPLELKERSNLYFPHRIHLDRLGLLVPARDGIEEKVVLSCASCHVPEPGGARMALIGFEQHCHRCHKLEFEMDDPGREVPHGNVRAVLRALRGYYALRSLENVFPEFGDSTAPQRLRPGEEVAVPTRREGIAQTMDQARQVTRELFQYQACAKCHKVEIGASPNKLGVDVAPVRVAETWFPGARFDHARHGTVLCGHCHRAARSEDSEDVLIPGIESCRECHAGPEAVDKVASTCISCHGFHVSPKFAMDGKPRETSPELRRSWRRGESLPTPED